MRHALREAGRLLSGWLGGGLVALATLLAAFLGAFVSPLAAAVVLVAMLVALTAAFIYVLRMRAFFDGPYIVLDNEVSWLLSGPRGETAKIRNHRHVRYNYRCAVIVERVNGMPKGSIESLETDYGEIIQAGKRRDEEYAIVELPADKQRNDEGHLTYRLTLKNSFDSPNDCWIEHATPKQTKKAKLDIVFPAGLQPLDLSLWRKSNDKTETVPVGEGWEDGSGCTLWKEAGRYHFRLRERPSNEELYRVEWRWPPAAEP